MLTVNIHLQKATAAVVKYLFMYKYVHSMGSELICFKIRLSNIWCELLWEQKFSRFLTEKTISDHCLRLPSLVF